MLNLEAARKTLSAEARPLPATSVLLEGALGCRLAEVPRADVDLPNADVSVMDGYAVRAAEAASGAPLPVACEVPAGQLPPPLPPGTAARIFTGAVIPAGADTVVPQEQATRLPDGTICLAAVVAGSHIRRQGEVCSSGASLAAPGDVITPRLVALLGAAGASTVCVVPRARVAVLSTGSELVSLAERPTQGKVRDANGAMLAALARKARFPLTLVSRVTDEPHALRAALERALSQADLVITSGGVSVGDYDLVPQVLQQMGAQIVFHRVAIKPGKPVLVARRGAAWVVGLPGNPVSALVAWRLFAEPLGEALSGVPHALDESPEFGAITRAVANDGDRTILAPAQFQPGQPLPTVAIAAWKGSHDVAAVARANSLAVLDVGVRLLPGDRVPFYRLD
jgi:molybdopterin molybdotransferase